jgi:hypothetical protein
LGLRRQHFADGVIHEVRFEQRDAGLRIQPGDDPLGESAQHTGDGGVLGDAWTM